MRKGNRKKGKRQKDDRHAPLFSFCLFPFAFSSSLALRVSVAAQNAARCLKINLRVSSFYAARRRVT
jgi:hypothetical protein